MVTRKESIVRQAEMRVLTSPDHERIMLIEAVGPAGLWAGYDIEANTHCKEVFKTAAARITLVRR
jgi:hypothetical protein